MPAQYVKSYVKRATRAHMSEFGIVAPVGRIGLERLLAIVADKQDERIPPDAGPCLGMLGAQLAIVKDRSPRATGASVRVRAIRKSRGG